MRAPIGNNVDDSSLDTSNMSSVDQREAREILASLGKKYYKSVGMGKSLDINKLRQLQGNHTTIDQVVSPTGRIRCHRNETNSFYSVGDGDHRSGKINFEDSEIPKVRLSRPDAMSHFPFTDKVCYYSNQLVFFEQSFEK